MAKKKTDLKEFNYKEVAKYDAEMWWAYYNRHFFKLFWRLLHLIKNQIGLSWPATLRAAYYAAWAAADYRINRGEVNERRIVKNLTKFYKIVSVRSTEPFDHHKAAELELKWWNVHRSSYKNNEDLERALARSAAVIYHVRLEALKEYAHYRAEAMILPQHEADNDQPHPPDWRHIRGLLVKAWQSLYEATKKESNRTD